jgi:hypothetical protein
MAKSKIKPKRSLASRKRGKQLGDGDANWTQGLPEPLRKEVEGCMSRKLRDLLRRTGGSLNPSVAADKQKLRLAKRAAEEEARAAQQATAKPANGAKKRPAPRADAPAGPAPARPKRPRGQDDGDDSYREAPPPAHPFAEGGGAGKRPKTFAAAAKPSGGGGGGKGGGGQGGGRPPPSAVFKTGKAARFGETNAAPPELAFSQRLLKKAAAHAATGGAAAKPSPSGVELERARALAEQREQVRANYQAAKATASHGRPASFQRVPEFVPRSLYDDI